MSATTGKEIAYQEKHPTMIFYAVEGVKDLDKKADSKFVDKFIEDFTEIRRENKL